uniref:Uncharacterized protein n=1 Tax=Oryza meridionalis TaxID=40149 RepID=A0A0E0DT47_9ORYZ
MPSTAWARWRGDGRRPWEERAPPDLRQEEEDNANPRTAKPRAGKAPPSIARASPPPGPPAMAYRRKHGMQRSATFVEDHRQQPPQPGDTSSPAIASPRATRFADDSHRPDRSLAAQAMLSSAAASSPQPDGSTPDPVTQPYTSARGAKGNETKHGFWGVLAQQAIVMLDENGGTDDNHSVTSQSRWSYDRVRKPENPPLDIGCKIKTALEEGLTKVEGSSRTGDGVHGRKMHIRRKACSMDLRNSSMGLSSPEAMSPTMSDTESPQIKASRDVASAMAAKVKLLQRELKTVKADMAFSRERCAQLEEENRMLRDGKHDADEDLIRQQLETLLAEKARLANENTVYARENRFLREIVEFHQLNMQDVVDLDDEDMAGDGEEGDDDQQQYGCHLRAHEAAHGLWAGGGGLGTAPQSPLGHAGRTRMSRSNSRAADAESPTMLRSLKEENVDELETPPTRRCLKEEPDVDAPPETPPTRRSLKEEADVDAPSETPPTRQSLKEADVDEPDTPPTHRSLKETDVDEPETPPTRRSIKEDADDAPETPTTKQDIGSPETATTPARRSSNDDLGAAETTTPTRRSFKDDNGVTEMKNEH